MSKPATSPEEIPPASRAQVRWFLEEVHLHDASLKNYVRHAFPSVRDVEDVVQESYLRLWKRQMARPIADVTGSVKASVRGFLFQVARRLALDKIRRDKASPVDGRASLDEIPACADSAQTPEIVGADQAFEFILAAIDRLPARCREVVIQRKLHGLSPAETALALGISEETVHVQTRRGLQRVQEYLRAQGVIEECAP